MSHSKKVKGTAEAWENGELGRDEQFVAIADDIKDAAVDNSLELQMISIRMQKSLLEDLKMIARIHGIGYQPLMKQVLSRFVECEKRNLLIRASQEAPAVDEEGNDKSTAA